MKHPLHRAVADTIADSISSDYELLRDPACGGSQQLPLFVGRRKARDTRLCCVDLLVVRNGAIRAIVEIEESGFLPTKICGKFLQAALADQFIHDTQTEGPLAYGEAVLFLQVLVSSACLKVGTRKDLQGELIRNKICSILPLGGLTKYDLLFVKGASDTRGLKAVGRAIICALE